MSGIFNRNVLDYKERRHSFTTNKYRKSIFLEKHQGPLSARHAPVQDSTSGFGSRDHLLSLKSKPLQIGRQSDRDNKHEVVLRSATPMTTKAQQSCQGCSDGKGLMCPQGGSAAPPTDMIFGSLDNSTYSRATVSSFPPERTFYSVSAANIWCSLEMYLASFVE